MKVEIKRREITVRIFIIEKDKYNGIGFDPIGEYFSIRFVGKAQPENIYHQGWIMKGKFIRLWKRLSSVERYLNKVEANEGFII